MKKIGVFVWRALIRIQRFFLIIGICFLIALLTSEVIMRYLIHYPGMEVEEIATLAAFWLYFLGAAYGTYDRSHIKAEVFHLVFKDNPRKLAAVRAVSTFIALLLAGLMTYWGYTYFVWGITKMERSRILLIPMVFSQSSIFVGAILMSLYFFAEFVDRVWQALGKEPIFKKEE